MLSFLLGAGLCFQVAANDFESRAIILDQMPGATFCTQYDEFHWENWLELLRPEPKYKGRVIRFWLPPLPDWMDLA